MKNNFVEVIDDFLTKSYYECLRASIFDPSFPWFYNENSTHSDGKLHYINNSPTHTSFGFTHNFLIDKKSTNSEFTNLVLPLVFQIKDYLNASEILRVRMDMTLYNPEKIMHPPHVDSEDNHYSAIYYLNESNGSTVIFNEKMSSNIDNNLTIKETIEPKPNRLVVFDGSYIHTGYSPSNNNCRVLINSNFVP